MSKQNKRALALKGKTIEQLRQLAERFLKLPPDLINRVDRQRLLEELSAAVATSPNLARELGKSIVTIKPSFYLMAVTPRANVAPSEQAIRTALRAQLTRLNERLNKASGNPSPREFTLEELTIKDDHVVECSFLWQRIHWYWAPDTVDLRHVYELRTGLAIIDFQSRKALIACQTETERDDLASAIRTALSVSLSPLVLTRDVLTQIGKFDKVRKATYVSVERDPNVPENVTFADDRLAALSQVQEEENNPRRTRAQSFDLIPLEGAVEQGVGATSHSGKLWVPKQVPLDSVRTYGRTLLGRIAQTLDKMTRTGETDRVLQALGLSQISEVAAISPNALRDSVVELIVALVNMLRDRQGERAFTMPAALAVYGFPRFFTSVRLRLDDPKTGEIAYWEEPTHTDSDGAIARCEGITQCEGLP
jgi:hypothetical protein